VEIVTPKRFFRPIEVVLIAIKYTRLDNLEFVEEFAELVFKAKEQKHG